MQTPPEFRPKTYVPVRNKIITTVGIILLSGVVGFGTGYAGSGSLTLAHSQYSQMSFMYGFFFVKFLFLIVVCVVIVI